MIQENDYSFKIVMVGNSCVGKSTILFRFVDKIFKDTLPTIGVDFKFRSMIVNSKKIKL